MNREEAKKELEISNEILQHKTRFLQKISPFKQYDGRDKVISSNELIEVIKSQPKKTGFFSGFDGLDDYIGDFRGGQLVVLSAPTGHGKTTLAQTWTYSFASQDKFPLWFSFEMGYEEFLEKFGDNVPAFFVPKEIVNATSMLDWIKARTYEAIIKYNAKVVFIDHLHFLMRMKDFAGSTNISLLVGSIVRELKLLAVESDITIFLISHITKIETGTAPQIDDLRDSSFTAQEADIVLMLNKEVEKDRSEPGGFKETGYSFLRVLKNRRTGRLGSVKLGFNNGILYEANSEKTVKGDNDNKLELF